MGKRTPAFNDATGRQGQKYSGSQISPTGVITYQTWPQAVDLVHGSRQSARQDLDNTNISSQPIRYPSDAVSTGAEGKKTEGISVQTLDPAVPTLPESSITVNRLQTSFEDIKETESRIPMFFPTDGSQGGTPSLESDISRVTSGQSIDSTEGDNGVKATRPPQVLQGASEVDLVAGLSQHSGAVTITTEYRSFADPDYMVTLLKSTAADSRTRLLSGSILDQDGDIIPNSMSSLYEVPIVGGSTFATGEKTFDTRLSEHLPSTTFNDLQEAAHISTFGTPQRLEVDRTQIISPNDGPASHAHVHVNAIQTAPGWTIPSIRPSKAVGSVSPSVWVTVSDIPLQDAGNQEGAGAFPRLTDTSTSETQLGYASPHEPTTGEMVGPRPTGSEALPTSGDHFGNAEHTDPVYEASVSHVPKKRTVSLSMSVIIPSSCIFVLIFEFVRRRNLRRRARLRAHQLRLDPTKSYFSLETSR